MITKEKIESWQNRKKVEKFTQYQYKERFGNTYNAKKEKLYDYYICDYCRMQVKIMPNLKTYEQEGGKVRLPVSLLNDESVEIAAHNRCIKSLIKELEELRKEVKA